ncbi:MAG: hypothetical protein HQL51_10870 [Magnetococcales bacterium]|nr:hypothetical protein [Magnetococcales bacterium]
MNFLKVASKIVLIVATLHAVDAFAAQAASSMSAAIARCAAQNDPPLPEGEALLSVIACLETEMEGQYNALSPKRRRDREAFTRLTSNHRDTYIAWLGEIMVDRKGRESGDGLRERIMKELIPDLHQVLFPMVEMRREDPLCYPSHY